MFYDDLKLEGSLIITLNDDVVAEVPNLVVTAGKNFVASRMGGTGAAVMSHMAIGTSTTAAGAAQTALVTQNAIVALTSATVTTNAIAYVATFGAGTGEGAITEAGTFNAASSGTMLCRTVFAVVNKGSADSMTITWTVTVS